MAQSAPHGAQTCDAADETSVVAIMAQLQFRGITALMIFHRYL
jgi:hypothetical protein